MTARRLARAALMVFSAHALTTPPAISEPARDPGLWPVLESPLPMDAALETHIDRLLARMSLEEKVGQTIMAEIKSITPDDVAQYHIGAILNGGGSWPGDNRQASAADWVRLADAYYKASVSEVNGRTPIPIFWGTDAVHGVNNVVGATLFPHNIGLGAADDPELMRAIGEATALELRATGLDWTFAPTLAVAQDLRWGRSYESYSSDPDRVARLGAALIEGLQGRVGSDGFLGPDRIIATAKHFIGDGATYEGRDQGDARIDEATLAEVHGAGYGSALRAGVQTVMASFSSWNGAKMHGSRYLLTDILKGRMGFDGLVVGDWNGHGQLPGCTESDCADAFNAGVDLMMVPEKWKDYRDSMIGHVRAGRIDEARLDDAVRRILRVKMRAGLFDAGPPSRRPHAGDQSLIGAPRHRALAREAARKSLVLLKNENALLPLSPSANLLVVGPAADSLALQSGGWTITWQGRDTDPADFPGATTILAGLKAAMAAGGGSVSYSSDGNFRGPKPDAVILVFGETPYAEFQGDLESLDFGARNAEPEAQMRAYRKAGIPVIAIFLSGRPLYTSPEINLSDAFIAAWLPGSEGGAIADLVIADMNGKPRHDFSGKLPFAWPAGPQKDGVTDAAFPIGYGLDYATGGADPVRLPEVTRSDSAHRAMMLYDGRPAAPWQLYIGDEAGWRVPANGARKATASRKPFSIERANGRRQDDSLRLVWRGGEAQAYLQHPEGRSFSDLAASGAALAFDILIEDKAPRDLELRMQCGWPCQGKIALAPILGSVAVGEWSTIAIDLACFARAGAKMDHIDVPFLIWGKGKGSLMLSDMRILPDKAGVSVYRCR
ncbi:MAG: exo 1,3/1,4-beta-D-glucan glucohydrolase [Rhodothalassiaceae bacterium]